MNALFVAAKEVADFMKSRGWKFCVIGGLAVQRWGEPLATLCADLTLLTGFGDEERYATALLAAFHPHSMPQKRSAATLFSEPPLLLCEISEGCLRYVARVRKAESGLAPLHAARATAVPGQHRLRSTRSNSHFDRRRRRGALQVGG